MAKVWCEKCDLVIQTKIHFFVFKNNFVAGLPNPNHVKFV